MSWRLGIYISKVFLRWFFISFFVFSLLIFLIEYIELTRRAASLESMTSVLLLKMALYKTPVMIDTFLPFMCFFGALLAYWRLQKNSELIAMGALGLSGNRIFIPVALVSFLIGTINLSLINPISASLKERYDLLEQRFFSHTGDTFSLEKTGLWVRQKNENQTIILNAQTLKMRTRDLSQITAYLYEADIYVGRIDAKRGILFNGNLRLLEGWKTMVDQNPVPFKSHSMALNLSFSQIKKSLKTPQTLSFWELQNFATLLDNSGISSLDHRLHWHRLLASPLWLCALSLLALSCMLTAPRHMHLMSRLLAGIFGGFFLYFLRDITQGMASSGSLPLMLAVWGPIILSLSIGMALMLQTEGH